jgi:hypothetical protein
VEEEKGHRGEGMGTFRRYVREGAEDDKTKLSFCGFKKIKV